MIRRPPRSTLFPTRRSSDLYSASTRGYHSTREKINFPLRSLGQKPAIRPKTVPDKNHLGQGTKRVDLSTSSQRGSALPEPQHRGVLRHARGGRRVYALEEEPARVAANTSTVPPTRIASRRPAWIRKETLRGVRPSLLAASAWLMSSPPASFSARRNKPARGARAGWG